MVWVQSSHQVGSVHRNIRSIWRLCRVMFQATTYTHHVAQVRASASIYAVVENGPSCAARRRCVPVGRSDMACLKSACAALQSPR